MATTLCLVRELSTSPEVTRRDKSPGEQPFGFVSRAYLFIREPMQ